MSPNYTVEDAEAILRDRGAETIRRAIFPELTGRLNLTRSHAYGTHPRIGKKDKFYFSLEKPVWDEKTTGAKGNWISYCRDERGMSFQDYIALLERETGLQISKASPEQRAQQERDYQEKKRKNSLLEDAFSVMRDALSKPAGERVLEYLTRERAYSEELLGNMPELGAYTSSEHLINSLEALGYSRDEIGKAGLLRKELGSTHQLAILFRDRAGGASGLAFRAEQGAEPKYLFTQGFSRGEALLGFDARRAREQGNEVIIVEGLLDVHLLQALGFSAGALGSNTLTQGQIEHLKLLGIKIVRLSLDMDESGLKGTKKAIRDLLEAGIKPLVVSLPEPYKDPDEMITALRSPQDYSIQVAKAELYSSWSIREIFSRYQIGYEAEHQKALREALSLYASISDSYEARKAREAILKLSNLRDEGELDEAFRIYHQEHSKIKQEELSKSIMSRAQERLSIGDIEGFQKELEAGALELRGSSVETIEPYTEEDFIRDILEAGSGLLTGLESLDTHVRIPTGAVSIIAGKPAHGKTTMMLNLLLNVLAQYPDKQAIFFSYEEHKRDIVKKLIMILSGVILDEKFNQERFTGYLKGRERDNEQIEKALRRYSTLVASGRLLIVDEHYPAEKLSAIIQNTASKNPELIVFADYIQKIPLEQEEGVRYRDLAKAIELLEEQAIKHSIPVIVGAQISKDVKGKPTLESLRESANLGQTAHLVVGLYKPDEEQADESQSRVKSPESKLIAYVLKFRGGSGEGEAQLQLIGASLRISSGKARASNIKEF